MAVMVTGGAGYIGSHTTIELLEEGYEVVIVDNFCNSNPVVIDRIKEISGKKVKFYEADVRDSEKMDKIFEAENIDSIIHFAGLKAVGESVEKPVEYYDNNLISTLTLFKMMKKYDIKNFVFSSSATVYGDPESCPIGENSPLSVTNPYGRTKLMIEEMLKDIAKVDKSINIAILRYFNPVGAHKSGMIGEDPNGIPNNLVPYITKVAIGQLEELRVFGNNYPTPDGTGVRDYIHVIDLAKGHVKAIDKLKENPGLVIYNLGTGKGYSVLEMIEEFSRVSKKDIPYKITERRAGDVAECYADPSKAKDELGWEAQLGLREMCEDSWRWQRNNPNGYSK